MAGKTNQTKRKYPNEHGGEHSKGKRKQARPIDTKKAIHVTFRSSRAKRHWSLLHPRHSRKIYELINQLARKHDVRVYRSVNAGNHVHLLLRSKTRKSFQDYLRELAGRIVQVVTGARKGFSVGRFWDLLAYSRIVSWGREFDNLHRYLIKNLFEAMGLKLPQAQAVARAVTLEENKPPLITMRKVEASLAYFVRILETEFTGEFRVA